MAAPDQCESSTNDESVQSPGACEAGHVLSMSELQEAYELTISVLGVKQSDLQVSASAGYLKVEGETSIGSTVYTIDRLFQFPVDSDLDLATAVHSDGVLSLTVPKVAKAQGKSIRITTEKDQEQTKTTASEPPRSNPVLSECTADDANVQIPEESIDDVEVVGETDECLSRAMPTPTRSSQVDEVHAPVEEEAAGVVQSIEPSQDHDSSEWDDLLGDLNEMGFEDRKSNVAALQKHAGSIKLAVKELVSERADGQTE